MSAVADSQYFCVKFPILSHLKDYEIMESVANIIQPQCVTASIPNHEEALVGVYVNNLESFCLLLQGGITVKGYHMCSLPLIGAYTASNVFPMVTNDSLTELFQTYGDIIEVRYVKPFSRNEMYDHIINDKRRLYFRLPGQNSTVFIPMNVKAKIENVSININIEQHCLICASDGHDVLHCADLKDFQCDTEILYSPSANPVIDLNISYNVQLTTNRHTNFVQKHITEKNNEDYELPSIQKDDNVNILQNIDADENFKSKLKFKLPSVHINQNVAGLSLNCPESKKEHYLEQKISEVQNKNAPSITMNCFQERKEHYLEQNNLGVQISAKSPTEQVDICNILPCMPDIVNNSPAKSLAGDDDMPILISSCSSLSV